MILVIAEHRDGVLNRASWEAVAAAQAIGGPIKVVVPGADVQAAAKELAAADVAEVAALQHAALGTYTPDGFVQALAALIGAENPAQVICAHTYQARDFIPKLAARLDRARRLVQDTTKRLQDSGWEAIVRVKEKTSTVSVLTKAAGTEGKIHGLAVLVVETDESDPQVVFANIAGTLDMAQLSQLSSSSGLRLEIPGLDQLGK